VREASIVKVVDRDIIGGIVERLREYLADVPFCALVAGEWESANSSKSPDWTGRLSLGHDQQLPLVIEARANGQPRIARDAVNQLLQYRARLPDAYCIFGAPYISAAAGKIAADAGVGYIDLAGNCRLSFANVYIRRAQWPNPAVERRGLRSLYSPKAERILRVLLGEPKRAWRIERLAAEAQVSLGMASKVKRLLEDREWLGRRQDGFNLREPAKLLAEWAENYNYRRNTVQDFYSLDPIPGIESSLANACRDLRFEYALTGFSAAARLAPTVRYQRATAYVKGRLDEVADRMGLKRVSSGANVTLIEPYDEGVLLSAPEVGGTRVVSPVQTYLDLLNFRGRGEEAAEALLKQVIQPTW